MSLSASQSWPILDRARWPGARRPSARVVLTRRGRAVVAGLLGAAIVGVAVLLGAAMATVAQAAHRDAAPAARGREMTRVVVRPGDTLWSIALRQQPTADPRVVVQQIMRENSLTGTVIQPGQRLWAPRG